MVETNPQYPDPHGAKLLLDEGIGPIIGTDIYTEPLVAQADSIKSEREDLAERVHDADRHEQSQTTSVDMY